MLFFYTAQHRDDWWPDLIKAETDTDQTADTPDHFSLLYRSSWKARSVKANRAKAFLPPRPTPRLVIDSSSSSAVPFIKAETSGKPLTVPFFKG